MPTTRLIAVPQLAQVDARVLLPGIAHQQAPGVAGGVKHRDAPHQDPDLEFRPFLDQRAQQQHAVVGAQQEVRRALGVRHQAEHVAGLVEDAGDAARRAVALVEIAQGDPALALEPVERRRVGLVVAVMMGDREDDFLARSVAAGET